AEDGIRDFHVTGVQTCALPISARPGRCRSRAWPVLRELHSSCLRKVLQNRFSGGKAASLPAAPRSGRAAAQQTRLRRESASPSRSEERRVGKESRYQWRWHECK